MVAARAQSGRAAGRPTGSPVCLCRAALLTALLLSCCGPTAAARLLSAAPAPAPAASADGNVTTGPSYITEDRYACPSNYRLVNDGKEVLYGPPDIVENRIQVELAWLNATAQELVPQGICNRYVNFTAHPSQTPGLENFTAIEEYYKEYSSSLPFSNPLTSQTTLFASQQMENIVALTWPSSVVLQWVRAIRHFAANDTTPLNVTTVNTADLVSTLRLQGKNLVPFHFDKQMLFIQTALAFFQNDNFPVGLMNFSDWRAAEAATSTSGPVLTAAGVDTILVDVWTTLIPYEEYTPRNLWSKVAAPDPRFWAATGAYNVPMNLTWVNGTMYTRPKGYLYADETQWTTAGIVVNGTRPSSGGGSSTGKVVGIAVGAVAAVVVIATLAWLLYLRRERQRMGLTHKVSDVSGSFSAAVTPISLPPILGEIDPAEFVVCRNARGEEVCLGEGNFGKVYKAIRHGTTAVAIKKLTGIAGDQHTLRQLRKEIAILKKVSYDANIVQFYGASTTEPAMLVMEFMEGGDLRNALWRELHEGTHEFDWYNKGRDVAIAVARGLNFLHKNHVVHRDVKSSNILLTREGVAKVGDVGLAIMTDYFSSASAATGTFAYAAPEILMGKPTTEKVDCFSYGVVLWEIITKEQTQRGNWRTVQVPEECPAEAEELLQDCLTDDVGRRPSMKEIVDRLLAIPSEKPMLVRASAPDVRDSADSLTEDVIKNMPP